VVVVLYIPTWYFVKKRKRMKEKSIKRNQLLYKKHQRYAAL